MGARHAIVTTVVAAALSASLHAWGQPSGTSLEAAETLREALERAGFDDGIRSNGAPDLDRKLTSAAFGTSADAFVAGYYFRDELVGQGLGPLHVCLFDRVRREWILKPDVKADVEKRGLLAGGSVLGVIVHPRAVLLDTHASPSAGFAIVLDRSLNVLASLGGYGPHVTGDGAFWYFGNMVHFADTHQETLKTFDLAARKEVEIFPGARLSATANAYRRRIQDVYARMPGVQRVADFDRGIDAVAERGSTSFAFAVTYNSDYLEQTGAAPPVLFTIARCDRRSNGTWSCSERELEQFARDAGLAIARDSFGGYDKSVVESLVQAALNRRP